MNNHKLNFERYALAIALLFVFGCSNDKPEVESNVPKTSNSSHVRLTAQQLTHADIQVGQPKIDTVSNILRLQGKIDVPPQSIVSLSFPLGGYLKSTDLLPGMHVHRGQVLAVLEDMQFIQLQQDYLLAKEKLTLSDNRTPRADFSNKIQIFWGIRAL